MKLAVYGTLRKGGRLESYLGNATYLGNQLVSGYDMYSLGSYPYITLGSGTILTEVYEVDQEHYDRTSRMERSAGYEMAPIETLWGMAEIYFMTPEEHERMGEYPLITSGDWIKYAEEVKVLI